MKLFLDPAVADKPTGALASPAAAPTPAAPPAATTPATKTESASPSAPAAPAPEAEKKSAWMAEPPKQEEKKDPAKPEPEKKATEPEKFDLKVPEGFTMEAAAKAKFESSMKELGLDAKQAQKLLEKHLSDQKASHEETISYLKQRSQTDAKELESEWGTKYAEKSERVKRAFDYADPDRSFRKELEAAYLGNNKRLIKFVEKFADLLGEDSIATGPNAAKAGKDNRPLQERSRDAFSEFLKKGK